MYTQIELIATPADHGMQQGIGYSLTLPDKNRYRHAVSCSTFHPLEAVAALRALADHLEAKLGNLPRPTAQS